MDDQRKDNPEPKRPPKMKCLQQLEIQNVPTNDVELTKGTIKVEDVRFANKPWTFPHGNRKDAAKGPEKHNYYTLSKMRQKI